MISLHTRIAVADLGPGLEQDPGQNPGQDRVQDRVHDSLVLPFEARERCRQRARLASGEEVAIFLVRGTVLRDGDLLLGEGGRAVRVQAALEPTYEVRCADPTLLARCAFHLGNRHARTEVGCGALRIGVDPVLRDMLEGLGAQVEEVLAKFEPEAGAYGTAGAGHGHGHGHGPGGLLAPLPLRQKIHRPSDLRPPEPDPA